MNRTGAAGFMALLALSWPVFADQPPAAAPPVDVRVVTDEADAALAVLAAAGWAGKWRR